MGKGRKGRIGRSRIGKSVEVERKIGKGRIGRIGFLLESVFGKFSPGHQFQLAVASSLPRPQANLMQLRSGLYTHRTISRDCQRVTDWLPQTR